jgi:3-methyladenine DNA glycosylase AlkD
MNAQIVIDYLNKNFKLKSNVSRKPTYGLSYPKIKLISKEIIKSNPIEFLDTNDYSCYELEILQTYVIGSLKNIDHALKYFDLAARGAKEWSVVDSLCQKFKIAKKYPKETLMILNEYAKIDDEFIQRIVAVTLLSHFLNDDYIHQSLHLIDQLNHQGYYLKMGKAWAVAEMMVKYPDLCFSYMIKEKMDSWTHHKAIQKMLESFRINDDMKLKIKQLKRKI